MSMITVEGPPISVEAKRQLAKELADALANAYPDIKREYFLIFIHENGLENMASGGELIADWME